MRKVAFLTLGALVGASAFAENPLQCVDPDVLKALVLPGGSERSVVIDTDLPEALAAIVVPRDFTLIGGIERSYAGALNGRDLRTVSAGFRSPSTVDAARAAALDALAAAGWEIQPPRTDVMGSGVFVSASRMPVAQAACRDGAAVNVTANALDGRTYVLYGMSFGADSSACDAASARPTFLSRTPLDDHLPKLELPADPGTGVAARMRGSGSSGGSGGRNFRVEFRVADSVRNVASAFAKQMAEQGWRADVTWDGSTTAGSTWTKETAEGALLASLRVTAVADGEFMTVLSVTPVS